MSIRKDSNRRYRSKLKVDSVTIDSKSKRFELQNQDGGTHATTIPFGRPSEIRFIVS